MPDTPPNLEHELRQLTPMAPSANLETRIETAMRHAPTNGCHGYGPNLGGHTRASCASKNTLHPLADRLLATTLSLAAAAILIITLLATDDLNTPPQPAAPRIATAQPNAPTLADTQRLLAQLTDDSPPPRLAPALGPGTTTQE